MQGVVESSCMKFSQAVPALTSSSFGQVIMIKLLTISEGQFLIGKM